MREVRLGLRVPFVLLTCGLLAWAWRSAPPSLTRGPYLQSTSETSVTVVCQTGTAGAGLLRFGKKPGSWESERSTASGTTHVFALTDLRPETRYYYELSVGGAVLAEGDDHFFRTAPPQQSRAPFRFLAWGDSGTGSTTQMDTAARMVPVVSDPHFAIGLGDLVYDSGAASDYNPKLFTPYAEIFRRMTFWPTIGNHDYKTSSGAPYFDAFYLPTQTGAPGHPSGTEKYYSFDYGMAHFTCLDSESTSSSPGGAMYDWCEADLDHARSRGKRWLIVYMHHPPYSKGTHDSDSESSLKTLHDNLVPLFDAKSVDMVMVGHSHVYERSYLIKNDTILQNDPGNYSKISSPDGSIYIVSGCGGKTGSGDLDHPVMAVSYGGVAGFNVIDVSWEQLHGSFVERDGSTTDLFRLRKATDTVPPRLSAVKARSSTQLEAHFDEPVMAGTGTSGAENVANYQIQPAVAVLGATLDSDQRTVVLTTGNLALDRAHELTVLRVADKDGNGGNRSLRFVRNDTGSSGGGSGTPIVARGSTWRYAKGTALPPSSWNTLGFNDSGWLSGQAGFGFADSDDATVLSDMLDNYVSVYTRIVFAVADPSQITDLALAMNYDDGFVAYLNGSEIARDRVPAGQDNTTAASSGHEAGSFESFDVGSALALLQAGNNVLAIEGHNYSISSSDFSLHGELLATLAGSGGGGGGAAPTAVLEAEVHTANVPARLFFSGARSSDGGGSLASLRWDFGDGSAPVNGTEVEHVYTAAGSYVVTLTVADADGNEDIDQLPVRIHAQGSAPVAAMTPGATQIDAGDSVSFTSAGSQDGDGGTIWRDWDFDDPSSGPSNHSTQASPSHVFSTAGTYNVILTVVDDEGSADSESTVITVGASAGTAPTARFSSAALSADELQITFTDLSTGDVTAWSWDFGDGQSSTQQSPVHDYAAAGTYSVLLSVTGPAGSDVESDTIDVGDGGGGGGGGGDDGGSGGGACSGATGSGSGGDPSLALALSAVLLALVLRNRAARVALARSR